MFGVKKGVLPWNFALFYTCFLGLKNFECDFYT